MTPPVLLMILLSSSMGRAETHPKPSAAPFEIVSAPGASLKIDGDSTVRKFSATGKPVTVRGKASLNPETTKSSAAKAPWIPIEVEFTLPVTSLSSGERTLDKHMYESLKAEQFPVIHMKLSHFEVPASEAGKPLQVKATGELTVAGVTRPLELEPSVTIDQSKVTIHGKKRVLMTDFGITPPVLMMGTLKTRNEIDVSYDVELSPQTANGA